MDNVKRLVAIFGQSKVEGKTQDELIDMLIDEYLLLGGENLKPIKEILVDFDRRIFKQEWIDNIRTMNNRDIMDAFTIGIDGEPKAEYIGGMDFGEVMEKDRGMMIIVGGGDEIGKAIKRIGFHSIASHLVGMSLSTITTDRVLPTMTRPICPELTFPEVLPIVTETNSSVNPNDRKYQNKSKKQRRKK